VEWRLACRRGHAGTTFASAASPDTGTRCASFRDAVYSPPACGTADAARAMSPPPRRGAAQTAVASRGAALDPPRLAATATSRSPRPATPPPRDHVAGSRGVAASTLDMLRDPAPLVLRRAELRASIFLSPPAATSAGAGPAVRDPRRVARHRGPTIRLQTNPPPPPPPARGELSLTIAPAVVQMVQLIWIVHDRVETSPRTASASARASTAISSSRSQARRIAPRSPRC
jgi:hypothetical protein